MRSLYSHSIIGDTSHTCMNVQTHTQLYIHAHTHTHTHHMLLSSLQYLWYSSTIIIIYMHDRACVILRLHMHDHTIAYRDYISSSIIYDHTLPCLCCTYTLAFELYRSELLQLGKLLNDHSHACTCFFFMALYTCSYILLA